jgi:glyoxylase-like metal-dependent hydrolase (beta-lactamase superfamily II)
MEPFQLPHGTAYICETCGVQFAESEFPPSQCPICEDFRQYIGLDGQRWTELRELRRSHQNEIAEIAPGVLSIHSQPKFAIGQRALVIRTPGFNVLWDCVSLIDDKTIAAVRDFGGISAIAISHPHYYSTMVEWSEAFGNAPVFLHEADRRWVMRASDRIEFWSRETHPLSDSLTLIRCGGHFEGAQVLHSKAGMLFTGDVIQVCPDRRWVSFMRSYPNYIPLPAGVVRSIVRAIEPFEFDRLYGAWPKYEILTDAKGAVERSAERYIRALGEIIME